MSSNPKLGIIAGNGRFPFLVLDAARAQGYEVVVAAIKEETSPEIESRGATVHWLSLGELSNLIETFRRVSRWPVFSNAPPIYEKNAMIPPMLSCNPWASIPGRRLLRQEASSPSSHPCSVTASMAFP